MRILPLLLAFLLFFGCDEKQPETISTILRNSPSIKGKKDYLTSPYVTAGNRVYMVGHQDGTFPELGWHIKGEMGGIWNHPIKLMDGFEAKIHLNGDILELNKANTFVNYPMANMHVFNFPEHGLEVERWQFVPDGKQGVFVQFLLKNTSGEAKEVDFEFIGHTDLRPTWLGEESQMIDAKDDAEFEGQKWIVKDAGNNWFAVFGSDENPSDHSKVPNDNSNAISTKLRYDHFFNADETKPINFVIAGSYQSKENALSEYDNILTNYTILAEDKRIRYAALAEKSKLTIPDKDLEQAFEWLKYNCDWLVRTIPELGTGIGAGIPDYPWFFGVDSEYALKGYMAVGQEAIVNKTIKLLDSVSTALNGNGKIIHEMSTNGVVFNPGNINETPQFASLIWEVYQWNGNKEFLKTYFPTIEKGLNWLMQENDSNGNLFPDGFGMMEIHGLDSEMIDVAAYTQRAFADAAKMADVLEKTDLANQYEALAANLKDKINNEFWSNEFNSYADFLGTDEQALHLIDDAIVRADTLNKPWAIEELGSYQKENLSKPF